MLELMALFEVLFMKVMPSKFMPSKFMPSRQLNGKVKEILEFKKKVRRW